MTLEPGLRGSGERHVDICESILELRKVQRPPVARTGLAHLRGYEEAVRLEGLSGKRNWRIKNQNSIWGQDPVQFCEGVVF